MSTSDFMSQGGPQHKHGPVGKKKDQSESSGSYIEAQYSSGEFEVSWDGVSKSDSYSSSLEKSKQYNKDSENTDKGKTGPHYINADDKKVDKDQTQESDYFSESGEGYIELDSKKVDGSLPAFKRPSVRAMYGLCLATALLLLFRFLPFSDEAFPVEYKSAQHFLGILFWALTLWISRTFPLFVTAITIPILSVWERVILTQDKVDVDGVMMRVPIGREQAASRLTEQMLTSLVFLVMAECFMAAALKHYKINSFLVSKVLNAAARVGPNVYLIALTLLGYLLCAFTSNLNAPSILIATSEKHFGNLPNTSVGRRLRSLILSAIMVSTNVGGMATPIASPQNAILLYVAKVYGYNITFANFMGVSFLTGIITSLACLYFLRGTLFKGKIKGLKLDDFTNELEADQVNRMIGNVAHDVSERDVSASTESDEDQYKRRGKNGKKCSKRCCCKRKQKHSNNPNANGGKRRVREGKKIFVSAAIVCVVFVILSFVYLAVSSSTADIRSATGGSETTSILVICVMLIIVLNSKLSSSSGANFLNSIPWPLIILLMCGSTMIYSFRMSGLLQMIGEGFHMILGPPSSGGGAGQGVCNWGLSIGALIFFLVLMMVFGSLATHTVSAFVILPMVAEFGISAGPRPCFSIETYLILTTMICSTTAILPVSSFPNMAMGNIVDQFGSPFLKERKVLAIGAICAAFCLVSVLLLGFGLSMLVYG